MRKKGSYRIKDIAIMSGVSTGTVDRIIHNRGKVSEEARIKVEEVLKKVDYRPNIVASALASKKNLQVRHAYSCIFQRRLLGNC